MSDSAESIIESVRRKARERRDRRIRVQVPDYNMVLVCRVPGDGTEIENLMNRAEKEGRGKAKGTNFNRAVVANFTEAIEIDEDVLLDKDGEPQAFSNPNLWKLLGVHTAKDACYEFLGTDGIIGAVAAKLLEEAGFAEQGVEVDPI